MMVEKTLSTGTLNLRFMQNARRAPHMEQEQAHVKDDGQWEVSPETRLAWAYRGEKAITYETSYLPFLFPSLHETLSDTPRGRRVFGKRGQDVTNEASSSSNIDQEPLSISSTRVPNSAPRHSQMSTKDPSKDAKNLIFDMSRVGTDLRHSQATAFLRPAGVDGPAKADPTKTASHASTGAIHSKLKRSRASGEADKASKKTKLSLIK